MRRLTWALGAILLAALGAVSLYWLSPREPSHAGTMSSSGAAHALGHARGTPAPEGARARAEVQPSASGEASERPANRERADEIRRALFRALGDPKEHPDGAPPSKGAEAESAKTPSMPAPEAGNSAKGALGDYVKGVVREQFFPMARDCYEELLGRHPDGGGDIALDFTIGGDEDLGGVVELADVNSKLSSIQDEAFALCLRESMYGVVFDAPPPGHPRVSVTYPIRFAPTSNADGSAPSGSTDETTEQRDERLARADTERRRSRTKAQSFEAHGGPLRAHERALR